ncbi:hypothetical protein KL942_003206 [Ogataea angusta]|uniref:Uncharacterized protein n=1 Tax=Pichia angusta TaxID=870730 RepID=A0ABQ7RVX6_PICAN|nr:hypothetical protein KL942_003206 [Ogataea angusta]KAG7849228.1 hypothetical protein KL940_002910 [Ogataea angusta]
MSVGGPVPVWKKYTTGSKGIWELIRSMLVLVPNRSSGNPYVPYYRVPSPSSSIQVYKDPRTVPAADIVQNDYFKRDKRRAYPRASVFTQPQIGALLQIGNAKRSRLPKGEEGAKQLALASSGQVDLPQVLRAADSAILHGELLGPRGEPVVAPNLNKKLSMEILEEPEHGMYTDEYPVRMFKLADSAHVSQAAEPAESADFRHCAVAVRGPEHGVDAGGAGGRRGQADPVDQLQGERRRPVQQEDPDCRRGGRHTHHTALRAAGAAEGRRAAGSRERSGGPQHAVLCVCAAQQGQAKESAAAGRADAQQLRGRGAVPGLLDRVSVGEHRHRAPPADGCAAGLRYIAE